MNDFVAQSQTQMTKYWYHVTISRTVNYIYDAAWEKLVK